jgi:hypothetical protein
MRLSTCGNSGPTGRLNQRLTALIVRHPRRPAMMIDHQIVAVGDLVPGEPPRGAAVADCRGARWFRDGGGWVQDPGLPVPGTTWTWQQLRDLHGPLRLSR